MWPKGRQLDPQIFYFPNLYFFIFWQLFKIKHSLHTGFPMILALETCESIEHMRQPGQRHTGQEIKAVHLHMIFKFFLLWGLQELPSFLSCVQAWPLASRLSHEFLASVLLMSPLLRLARIHFCYFQPKKLNCYSEIQDFFNIGTVLHI